MESADDIMRSADNKFNKKSFLDIFSDKNQKYEEAADIYERAASQYKMEKKFKEAGMAHKKQAECFKKINSDYDTCNALKNAVNYFKKDSMSINDVHSCLEECAATYISCGKFGDAAKCYKEFAEFSEKNNDYITAVEYYEKAIDNFEKDDKQNQSTINECKKQMALYIPYDRAAILYEELAKISVDVRILSFNVANYLLRAGLCRICMGDMIGAEKAIDGYINIDATFDETKKDCKFLKDIMNSVNNRDMDDFKSVISKYDSTNRFDNWMIQALTKIKEMITDTENDGGIL